MLSIVTMSENFNEDSEFVRRVVKNNMRGIREQNPKQDRMLSILACLKYFLDGNLLESICEKFLDRSELTVGERICPQLKQFVEIEAQPEEGYGQYNVIKSHTIQFLIEQKMKVYHAIQCSVTSLTLKL